MKWVSTVSDAPSLDGAVRDVIDKARSRLDDDAPDLVVVFVSEHHQAEYDSLPDLVATELRPGVLIGCSAGGVIGGGREVEHRPGVSMTAAVLPGVELDMFHLASDALPDLDAAPESWHLRVGVRAASEPHFLLFP